MKTSTLVGGSTLTSLVGGMVQFVGVPSGAALAIVIIGLVGTIILSFAQVAMPQESQDKRLLWERFFEYLERRHSAASANKRRTRKAEQAAAGHDATVAALAGTSTSSGGTAARSS